MQYHINTNTVPLLCQSFSAPTILSLLGIDVSNHSFHGRDMSSDILEPQSNDIEDNTIFLEDTYQGRWAAVISNGYKYVLSKNGIPWVSLLYVRMKDLLCMTYNCPVFPLNSYLI